MIEHLSYSSISMYLDCGRQWWHKYVNKDATLPSPELLFGSAWHGTVEQYIQTGGNLLDHWQNNWSKQLEKNPNCYWDTKTPEEYQNMGVSWTTGKITSDTGHVSMADFLRTIKPTAVEKKISLQVPGVPVPVIGFIDVITEDGIPGDFKTSAKSWSAGKAADEMQTLFYLAALNQERIHVPGNRFRHYIFVKNKTPKVQILEHSHNLGELLFLFRVIQNVWKGVEAGVFIENPTSWRCDPKWCDFWNLCRGKYGG